MLNFSLSFRPILNVAPSGNPPLTFQWHYCASLLYRVQQVLSHTLHINVHINVQFYILIYVAS